MPGDVNYSKLSLLLQGRGLSGSAVITDTSPRTKTVTVNATTISLAVTKFIGTSMAFNGTTSYLSIPHHADFVLGSGDFTMGAWIYVSAYPASNADLAVTNAATKNGYGFRLGSAGLLSFIASTTGYDALSAYSDTVVPLNTLTYIEANRISGVITMYVGGVAGTHTASVTTMYDTGGPFVVGRNPTNSSWYFSGYIEGLFLVKGTAEHSANFSVPTAPRDDFAYFSVTGDNLFPYVGAQITGNGTNGASAVFTDNTGTPFTVYQGSPVFSNTWSADGGSSLYFNGTSVTISAAGVAKPANINFAGNDFEISLAVYQTSRSGSVQACLLNYNADSPAAGWRLYLNTNGTVTLAFTGSGSITSTVAVALNTATVISVSRYKGVNYIRLNGIQVDTTGTLGTQIAAVAGQQLQVCGALGPNWLFTGYIDRIEVMAGSVRHTSNYTPETTSFLTFVAQVQGVIRDDTDTPCARVVELYRRDTGALVSRVNSNALTGYFAIPTQNTDPHTLVALDDDTGVNYNAIVIDRVIPA